MTTHELTYDSLKLRKEDVYEFMGMEASQISQEVMNEMDSTLSEVAGFLRPRLCFTVKRGTLNTEDYRLTIDNTEFETNRIVSRQLRGSDAYALFVCTAGVEFQEYQERTMKEGDMVKVFIVDAIGSCIAESCANRMEEYLQRSIDKLGWHRTNRFSPGYCGWHVREQQKLFPLIGTHANIDGEREKPKPCGVSLTNSSLMVPIKSVSGVIGLGPNVRYLEYTCGLCDFKKCYKKRKKKA